MGFESFASELRTTFNTAWAGATPIVWDNTREHRASDEAWIRFSVQPESYGQQCLGMDRFRTLGAVYVQIFTPARQGPAEGWQLSDDVAAILRGLQLPSSGLWIRSSSITVPGIGESLDDESDTWHQITMRWSFVVDEAV